MEAAKLAIEKASFNEITQKHQFPWAPKAWNSGGNAIRSSNQGAMFAPQSESDQYRKAMLLPQLDPLDAVDPHGTWATEARNLDVNVQNTGSEQN